MIRPPNTQGINDPTIPSVIPVSTQPATQPQFEHSFAKLPLYFEENQGQLDERVFYSIQGNDKTIYFTSEGVTFALMKRPMTTNDRPLTTSPEAGGELALRSDFRHSTSDIQTQRWAVKLDFIGANPNVRPIGQDKTEAVISYFKGSSDQWHAGLPMYSRIVYPDLWPGIDLVYYGTVNQLKYEFVIHPGADPAQIRMAYRGATNVVLNAAGQLEVTTPVGSFHDDTPVAYQDVDGQRALVQIEYILDSVGNDGTLSRPYHFRLGLYDPTRILVLDPAILVYCGYIGGSGEDVGLSVTVDSLGNTYVTGRTTSTEASFPVNGGLDLTYNGGTYDAFVVKVNAAGSALVYAGYIGGNDLDSAYGIAVDGAGNAYVVGDTYSSEATFPITVGPDLTYGGSGDAFVAQVNAAGTALVYAGYIGGDNWDAGSGIAVDGAGSAYIAGHTQSTEASFPVIVGPDMTFNGGSDAFVAKVNTAGTGLVYAGYIGGAGVEGANSIAVDSAGNAYVTGYTFSTEASFPTTVGPDLTYNGGRDAFVAKINATAGLVYAGYIGGSGDDQGLGIAVDSAGNAYVTGDTVSTQASFPVTVGPDLTFNGSDDAFVAKVNTTGTNLVYAGYIGGNDYEQGTGIAVNSAGNAYVTGYTYSTGASFPVVDGPDPTHNGAADAFVTKVNAAGTGLIYCGYIGGPDGDLGQGIAIDSAGSAYVAGSAGTNLPVVVGPDLTYNGGGDVFVAKISTGSETVFSISGLATDAGGNPLSGVTISASSGHHVTTGSSGVYTITGLLTGTYTLTPTKSDTMFLPMTRTVNVPPNATAKNFIGVPTSSLTNELTYEGPKYFPNSAVMLDEAEQRITTGDHIHLLLPFKNTGGQPITNAVVFMSGAPQTGSHIGVSVYNGSFWRNADQPVALTPSIIGPGETGWADFWIYVTNNNPIDRSSQIADTWLQARTGAGQWTIHVNLSPIAFDIPGSEALKASSCLHNPDNPEIQNYAQYAAGAPSMSTPPTNGGDPDTPDQAILNLVHRVNSEFHYNEDVRKTRVADITLIQARHGGIGVCGNFADLTTGLLRSLGISSRVTSAVLLPLGDIWSAGHAWAEAYLGPAGWQQADSTWNTAFDPQVYERKGYTVKEVWADLYPLSSASSLKGQQYRCIAPCYQPPMTCAACLQKSNSYRDLWFWQQPDLSCVENVTANYHQANLASFQSFGVTLAPTLPLVAVTGRQELQVIDPSQTPKVTETVQQLLVQIQSPTFVTRTVPFTFSSGIVNSTTVPLNVITATVAISEYVDSKAPLFQVMSSYRVITNVNPGQLITLTWVVTPLVTGSNIPVRVAAESGDLFGMAEEPLVVNEPGTLPDLSLIEGCGPRATMPGQALTLTASVLGEYLQPITDTATLITATLYSTPTVGFSTTVNLAYCASCGYYQQVVNLPADTPLGTYQADFIVSHTGYDPARAPSAFFVRPPLTMTLDVTPTTALLQTPLTLSAQVSERGNPVSEAGVHARVATPGGVITVPLIYGGGVYTATFSPADLQPDLGILLGGQWEFQAVADYYGSKTTGTAIITINIPPVSVTVSGSATVAVHTALVLTATVNPAATTPITYVWQAMGQSLVTDTGGLSDTATFTWTLPGVEVITITATNSAGMVTGTHVVTVTAGPLASITVTPNPVTVTVGAAQAFTAMGQDAFGNLVAINPTWSTDAGTMAGSILTVQTTPTSGKHVTATVGSVSGTAVVNVVAGPLASIAVTPNPATVTVGAAQAFTATGADVFGNAIPISLTWTTDAGTMMGNILTAQTTPTSGRHVTATMGGISGTATVNVVAGQLASIAVTPNPATVTVGAAQAFLASGSDVFGNAVPISPTWSTDAGIMAGNTLTAQTTPAAGRQVTATAGSVNGIATVNIAAGPLASITVTPNPITVTVGATQTFIASGADVYDNAVPVSPTWSTNAGTMTGDTLTAQTLPASGRRVTATVGSINNFATVNIAVGPLSRLTVMPATVTLAMGQHQQFSAVGFDSYSNMVTGLALSWQVTQPDAGAIDSVGLFTAGTRIGEYPGAVMVSSGTVSDTADVAVSWPHQIYLPLTLRNKG